LVELGFSSGMFWCLWPVWVAEVVKIGFEYSRGRKSAKYTDDRIAFDPDAARRAGFIGST